MLTVFSILIGASIVVATACALGVFVLRGVPAPLEIAFALGAVLESSAVFFLLWAHLGHRAAFLAITGLSLASLVLIGQQRFVGLLDLKVKIPKWIAVILGAYAVWYFVNALAPETLPDGITYHLGLPYEYVRLHGFPRRVTFYDMVPQGMEMLYTVAFAFGRHSAAKLVEWTFFMATVPLIWRIGRLLHLSDSVFLATSVLYFTAPIVGLTGSSSYNDAAGVFFTLATFYLLLVWRDTADSRYLLPAGAMAGFCYVVKFPGVFTILSALLFILLQRRMRDALRFVSVAALVIAPWLLRNTIVAHNPVAPILNDLFPNPFFYVDSEKQLASYLGSLGTLPPWLVPWQLAFGHRLSGNYGPFLLLLPIGLLALRRREGLLAWGAAIILAVPWYFNTGPRFLMPSVACAALALCMCLPRRVLCATVALQAALCWPSVMALWDRHRLAFRLREFPIAAALRIVPENEYLSHQIEEFQFARMVANQTPPDAKMLALLDLPYAYLDRDARVWWQSAEAERLAEALRSTAFTSERAAFRWKAEWPPIRASGVRLVAASGSPTEFDVEEALFYSGSTRIASSPQWHLRAWPNPWEAAAALDGNLLTGWHSRQPVTKPMFLEIQFDRPQSISQAVFFSHAFRQGGVEIYGYCEEGSWRRLGVAQAVPTHPEHLGPGLPVAFRAAGYQYILAPVGGGGNAPIGNALLAQGLSWGVEPIQHVGRYYLFRII